MIETKLFAISEKIRKAYNSKWAIFINIFLFLIIFILQLLLVYFLIIQAPTNHNTGQSYWWLIVVEISATISSIIASVLTIRVNKNFFYFNTFSLILWSVNSFMLGLYVDNIKIILLYLPIIIRFSRWRTGEHRKITPRRIRFVFVLPMLILLTSFSLICGFYLFSSFDAFPILDSFNLVFGVTQALLIAFGIIEGLLITYVVTFCLLWMNFASGNYIGVIVGLIFFININANIMAWLAIYHREHKTFKYQKIQKISPLLNELLNKYSL